MKTAVGLALGLLVALSLPAVANIQTNARTVGSAYMLNSANSNDDLSSNRTIDIPVGKAWAKLRIGVTYTYDAATSVTLTPSCSYDGSTFYQRSTRSCSSGACESAPMTDVETGTVSWTREIEYDVRGCELFRIVFSGGGSPTADDDITTQAILVAGD